MLAAVARAVSRRPWPVILGWVAATAVLVLLSPRLRDVAIQDNSAFLDDDAPSIVGGVAAAELWPEDEIGNTGALVFRRDAGIRPADREAIRRIEDWLRSPAAPEAAVRTQSPWSRPELREALRSEDGRVVIVVVGFATPPFQPETNEAVEQIREHVRARVPPGLEVHLTGNAGVGADQATAIDLAVHRTTQITLVLVVAILLWVYRSPITPLVPLSTVAISLVVAQGLVALLARAGMQVSSLVETFMVVIVFGAGTDYCLFIVSRYKEELSGVAGGRDPDRRVLTGAMIIIGGVIASSAATVIVGFASQGVARFGMYRTTGPSMAIAVVITLTAGLTLTPALLSVLGRWAFWPWKPRRLDTVAPAEDAA